MDVLVLYKSYRVNERRTVKDHLYSFARYCKDCRFVYLDVGRVCKIPHCIADYPFDAVIFHYSFLAFRLDRIAYRRLYDDISDVIMHLHGVKALIPHDEYLCTEALWQLSLDCGASRIFSSCYAHDYATIFPPEKVGSAALCRTVLTGYIDENLLKTVNRMIAKKKRRSFDIGYRALRSNYVFGRHGHLKTQVADMVLSALKRYPSLRTNIRMTSDGYKNMLTGNRWLSYLLDCRTTLGCLGGSSLLDTSGDIRATTLAYVAGHPHADYEEIEAHCYPGLDEKISAKLLGPRHLECAMTRTCQLLVEGDYHGVLQRGRDYIEIKSDFSNLDEVLSLVSDRETCQKIASQCYDDVVHSGKYTYRTFANEIIRELRSLCSTPPPGQSAGRLLVLRIIAALVHLLNQVGNAFANLSKQIVSSLTRSNPALYESIKKWYKER